MRIFKLFALIQKKYNLLKAPLSEQGKEFEGLIEKAVTIIICLQ